MIGSNEKGSGWIDTGHVVNLCVIMCLLWKIHKGVYVTLVLEHKKVTGKVSKEKCHFLEVGRRACVQELEASQWGWRADKKEVITR